MADKDCTCLQCGSAITPRINKTTGLPSKAKRKYCSRKCSNAYHEKRRPKRLEKDRAPRKPREVRCEHCHKTVLRRIRGGESDAGRFCSRDCAFGAVAILADERAALRRIAVANSGKAIGSKVAVEPTEIECGGCGEPFMSSNGRAYCAEKCRPSSYEWRPADVLCRECGTSFTQGRRWQRLCSDQCERGALRRQRRIQKGRREYSLRGVKADSIDPIKVFERDRWLCHLCGEKTKRSLRGSTEDLAPELEHIISIADGGSHTWGNVACSCRKCNGAKGAMSVGQLGFPFPV